MKLLKPLCALILIALALLLNAASANAQSPSPDPAKKSKTAATESQAGGTPVPTQGNQFSSEPSAAKAANYSYSYNYYRPSSESPPVWFQVITTIILLCFTGALWLTSYWQWGAIDGQAKIANENLLLQFRPKLIVRNVVVKPAMQDARIDETLLFIPNHPVGGQFYVANVGGSPATVTESLCIVHWQKGPLPMRRPYEGLNGNNPVTGRIKAGDRRTVIFASQKIFDLTAGALGSIQFPDVKPEWHIWIMGWIEYTDELGSSNRRTAFCRRYEPRTNRFVVVRDPDYEHEE
jgi:hypothetical protein